jgi:hypothetical protein
MSGSSPALLLTSQNSSLSSFQIIQIGYVNSLALIVLLIKGLVIVIIHSYHVVNCCIKLGFRIYVAITM